jgi:hypothetical protein
MIPFAFLYGRDQTAAFQHLHMVGQRRLGNLHLIQQFTPALFSASQDLNDPKPVRISQCFTDQGYLGKLHKGTSHRSISM